MPRTVQRKTVRRRRKGSNRSADGMPIVPATALSYNGPIVPRRFSANKDMRIEVLRLDTELVASGAGILTNVIGSNPASYANWSQYVNVYDEYRVLGLECHYEPYNKYRSAPNQSPMSVVSDRADSTALTSYQNALEYSSVSLFNTAQSWTKGVKMSGTEEATFTPIGVGVSSLYIKLYASILTNSTAVGRLTSTVLVQFRGTK
jgi:hypothetical protein